MLKEILSAKLIILMESLKNNLRFKMRTLRKDLCAERRSEASQSLADCFGHQKALTLSYSSFNDELATGPLNQLLCSSGILVLPKMEGNSLRLFRVPSHSCLITNSYGIQEPYPSRCEPVHSQDLRFALIPGLAFDGLCHRLGYGKGFYDRLLASLPVSVLSIGVGFKEQLLKERLPADCWDIPLKNLKLF